MARKRMIDPSIWTSDQFTQLSTRQRLIFIGLFSNADDEGRLRGEARKVKGLVFPTDDILSQDIENDLLNIAEVGLIRRWQKDGEIFIELPKWKDYQKMNYKSDSHLPAFDKTTDEILTKRLGNVSPQVREVREVREVKKELKTSASKEKTDAETIKNSERTEKQKIWDDKLEIVKQAMSNKFNILVDSVPYRFPGKVLDLVQKELNWALGAIQIFSPNGEQRLLSGQERIIAFIKWLNNQVHTNPNWKDWLEQGFKGYDRKNPTPLGQILVKAMDKAKDTK